MMCINLQRSKYVDLRGRAVFYDRPCGHCLACLHNQQDSWSIRISETAFAHPFFVYDTLTFKPSALTYVDVTAACLDDDIFVSPASYKLLDRYRFCDRDTGEIRFLAPAVHRSVISNWIKRARENFYLDNGFRPKWKYFICQEYGPRTSRPHFHLLFWGISQEDYEKYLGRPWSQDMGRRKTHFIHGTDKDRSCISRYISKYVSKGVFESPLVQDGLSPRPFRSISHGIGEELLLLRCYDVFRTKKVNRLKSFCIDKNVPSSRRYVNLLLDAGISDDVPVLTQSQLELLLFYRDRSGFTHALPRYYRQKLLNLHRPNVYSYTIQALLLANTQLQYNKDIQKFAAGLGIRPDSSQEGAYAGFGYKLYHLLCGWYAIEQKRAARAEVARCYTKLKNHYGRALNIPIS